MSSENTSTAQDRAADLPTLFSPETCTRKGLCPVTRIRHQEELFESHSLYYEQHGNGPTRVLFIMGLNSSSFAWWPQVAHFGCKPEYSVVVFDNRGVGNSGTPRGPYSTSGMAEDAVVLLDYLGWTEKRGVHVVGVSLGGMIAQELASRISERIISLTLAVTTPGGRPWSNLPPWKGFVALTRLLAITDPEVKIPMIHDMVFSKEWLDQVDEDDEEGRTNRELMTIDYRRRIAITRPQTVVGTMSQMAAGFGHHVTGDRLRKISSSIPKVLIVTGDNDALVHPRNSLILKESMPEAEYVQFEKCAHAIHVQHRKKFNALLERVFEEGKQLLEASPDRW
ncbi:alpha beta-hydrolase [Cristinia sonorae]|uniref:Alpha beta-hydrolase n=1 Tax=Cristinia sonorae TaxID=1940300 RepID=A0A8K0V0W0_9AGAR|nr:alpha beta-hydrolase [Cristinia sonorae]